MTEREALKILEGDFSEVALKDGQSHSDVYQEAFKMACDALKKADKYKWHDLRKNPNDLPKKEYKAIEVCLEDKTIDIAIWHLGVFEPWYAEYLFDYPPNWDSKVIAWREIEPFKESED